jgi:hypothetical protein
MDNKLMSGMDEAEQEPEKKDVLAEFRNPKYRWEGGTRDPRTDS